MWTKPAVAAHQRAIAVAEKWDAPIRKLEEIAKHAPALADRIRELRVMRDTLHALASTALAVDPEGE